MFRSNKKNDIILFGAIIFIFSALFLNYIIIKSFTSVDTSFLTSLDSIYFYSEPIDDSVSSRLSGLLSSNNTKAFRKLLEDVNNPINQFYGFCGLFKSNRILAIEYMKSGIMQSPKAVSVVVDKKGEDKRNVTLGQAVVSVLFYAPEWLLSHLTADFINTTSDFIYSLQQKTVDAGEAYRNELSLLIKNRYPKIQTRIINDIVTSKTVAEMTEQERTEVSNNFDVVEQNRIALIEQFLKDSKGEHLVNALNFITTAEEYKELIPVLEEMLVGSNYKTDTLILIGQKFTALLNGKNALTRLSRVMLKNPSNLKLQSEYLKLFHEYADDSWWDFMTRYLNVSYPVDLNNQALESIIHVSWKENPDNVYRTFAYCLKYSRVSTVNILLSYCIDNDISNLQTLTLNRLRLYERNKDLRLNGIKYIEKFRVYAGRDVLVTLLYDRDSETKQAARDSLDRLKWSDKMPEKEPEKAATVTETAKPAEDENVEQKTQTPGGQTQSQASQPQASSTQPQQSQPAPAAMQKKNNEPETRVQQSRPNREIEAPKRRPGRSKKDKQD